MQYNVLGCSSAMLAQLFETIKATGHQESVNIWLNVDRPDEIAYDPGIVHSFRSIDEFNLSTPAGLLFGAANPAVKKRLLKEFKKAQSDIEGKFINLVHPGANVASTASLAGGVYLEPGVTISPFAEIGFGVTVSRNSSIGHHARVLDLATINPGCTITGHCTIGRAAQIGAGSTVFDHVRIGNGAMIGGGSVVTKDIPGGVVAYGNPCQIIRSI